MRLCVHRRLATAFAWAAVACFGLATVSPVAGETRGGEGSMGITTGPDVTVQHLTGISNYGSEAGIRAYSVGTDSCNIGSEPVSWCNDAGGCGHLADNEHPVIAQNIYRLKEGRFEQLGMSWLKHGFLSLNSFDSDCFGNDGNGNPVNCQQPPLGGDQLGVGCTDFYSSGLNGNRPLGRRSEVNPTTGEFPYPPTGGGQMGTIGQRIQVAEIDLDPSLNPGARYWIEGHYIAGDDALEGNGLNNASHREVVVQPGTFNLSTVGGTVRELAAIHAWKAVDPAVEIVDVDLEGRDAPEGGPVGEPSVVERFHAARRVTDEGGSWHYEIAVMNLNSRRAGQSLSVQFPQPTSITGVEFHDVDHHSGEPYDTTDWLISVDGPTATVTWETEESTVNPNANALRWSTMFTFAFDADSPPDDVVHTLGLFEQGTPMSVVVPFNPDPFTVFEDGFESGDFSAWSGSGT